MNLQITSTFLSRWSVCYRAPTWGPSVYRACWSRVPQTHFWLVGGSGLWVKINTDILILIAGAQWDSYWHTGVSYYAANLSRSTCKVHRVRESGGVSEAWQLYLLTSSQACPVFMVHCSRLDCLGFDLRTAAFVLVCVDWPVLCQWWNQNFRSSCSWWIRGRWFTQKPHGVYIHIESEKLNC